MKDKGFTKIVKISFLYLYKHQPDQIVKRPSKCGAVSIVNLLNHYIKLLSIS